MLLVFHPHAAKAMSQDGMGWSNDLANQNIHFTSSTLETYQSSKGWLKAAAPENMQLMFRTLETSQEFKG